MKNKYIIISAVRNEEDYIEKTIHSVINQTVLPQKMVLVNDGSTDRTAEIINSYQKKYPWITRIDLTDRGFYHPGEGIVKAFYKGYDLVKDMDWDFVVKMDCDLSFAPDYFETMMKEFSSDSRLGIASGGIYNVLSEDKIVQEKGKEDHPWGAAFMIDRDCFNETGGLQPTLGWELASIIKAQMKGWNTRCFFVHILYHYRLTGGRHSGLTKGRFRHGRNLYRFGYPFFYIFLKAAYRLFEKPYFIGSAGIIAGYTYSFINRDEFLYDKKMRRHLDKRLKKMVLSNNIFSGSKYI